MSKKKLFKKWYEGYGKFIFQNFIVDEEAYHKIKEIFSSVYDMSMNSMNEKIKLIQDEIKAKIRFMKNEYKALKRTYDYLEHKKKMLSAEMSRLKNEIKMIEGLSMPRKS